MCLLTCCCRESVRSVQSYISSLTSLMFILHGCRDLHSLNNRLIQVEAILAMITNGQNPPAFQSSYPLTYSTSSNTAQQAVGTASLVPHSSGAHPHQHHHHYAAPSHISPHDSLSLSFNEMSSMWLEDLDLGLSCLPSTSHSASPTAQRQRSYSNPDNVGLIKLEPSPIDIELTQPQITPHSNNSGRPTSFPSRAPSPVKRNSFTRSEHYHQQQQKRSSAQQLLPALSIYYPIPSIPPPGTSVSSSAPFSHHPSNASPSSTSPSTSPTSISANNGNDPSSNLQTQYTKPQVTQALIALLPSLLTCNVFLRNARDIFRLRPIPFECGPEQGWKHFENRCLTLLGGGTNKEKAKEREKKEREREKAREARRARQIYFGGIPGLQPHVVQDTDMDDAGGGSSKNATKANADPADENEDISLTFFAIMCAVLAIGASIPPAAGSPISSSTADAIKSSPAFLFALSQQALGVWDTHASSVTFGIPSAAAEESEKLDYLLACIAGLCYLLFTSSPMRVPDTEGEGSGVTGLVYPLVGLVFHRGTFVFRSIRECSFVYRLLCPSFLSGRVPVLVRRNRLVSLSMPHGVWASQRIRRCCRPRSRVERASLAGMGRARGPVRPTDKGTVLGGPGCRKEQVSVSGRRRGSGFERSGRK